MTTSEDAWVVFTTYRPMSHPYWVKVHICLSFVDVLDVCFVTERVISMLFTVLGD